MSTLIPFQPSKSVAVLEERPQMHNSLIDSLPELLAARHHLSSVEINGLAFAVCACGHWHAVVGSWPLECSIGFLVRLRPAMTEAQFLRDLDRALRAGEQVEAYASSLLRE